MHASGPVIVVAGHVVLICMLQALDWCCWPCGVHMHASGHVIGVAGHEVIICMLQAL